MEILHPVKATFRTSDKNQLSNPDVSFMVEIFNQLTLEMAQGNTNGFFVRNIFNKKYHVEVY